MMNDAIEVLRHGANPIVLTCEHASKRLPEGAWGRDAWIQDLHWSVDLGIAPFTRALSERLQARAGLARFSRLWIDANRPLFSRTLFRDVADGRAVHLNHDLPDHERERRVRGWWLPFHDGVASLVDEAPTDLVLSMHSFTPVYEGSVREVEIGVLYDLDDAFAERVAVLLDGHGFCVQHNEPYSGKGGMMYSCFKHAMRGKALGLELEFRQDLLADPATSARLLDLVGAAISQALSER